MYGFLERLFGVQSLEDAKQECHNRIEEVNELTDLNLLCSLYTLNYNEEDGDEIKRILLKYSLTDFEYGGTIFNVVNGKLVVNEYNILDDLPPILQNQAD